MKRSPCDGVAEYASKEGIWGGCNTAELFQHPFGARSSEAFSHTIVTCGEDWCISSRSRGGTYLPVLR